MGYLIARNEIVIDRAKTSAVITGLSCELIFLIVGDFVEDTHSIISIPAKKEILVGIDLRTVISRLLERCIENDIILNRILNIYLLG